MLSRSRQPRRIGTPATAADTLTLDVHRADVHDADSGSSSHQLDSGRHSVAAAATTSASDASDAQGQVC
jgi:hypothetical protein